MIGSKTAKAVAARRRRYNCDARIAQYGVQCAQQAGARNAYELAVCLNYLRVGRAVEKPWNADAVLYLLRRLHDWGCHPGSLPAHKARDCTGRETAAMRLAAILLHTRAIYIAGLKANDAYALPDMTPEEIAIATAL